MNKIKYVKTKCDVFDKNSLNVSTKGSVFIDQAFHIHLKTCRYVGDN